MNGDLDRRLRDAHAREDCAAMVTLYYEAAAQTASETAKYFYLTHAYIFALDTNHPLTRQLHALLKAAGRET